MMSIVSNIANRMPNETREIGKKHMDNLKMLPQLTIGNTFGWQKICKLVLFDFHVSIYFSQYCNGHSTLLAGN